MYSTGHGKGAINTKEPVERNTVMPDGTFVISIYVKFDTSKTYQNDKGDTVYKTSIASKRINLNDIDRLAGMQNQTYIKL